MPDSPFTWPPLLPCWMVTLLFPLFFPGSSVPLFLLLDDDKSPQRRYLCHHMRGATWSGYKSLLTGQWPVVTTFLGTLLCPSL